jgi:hypothetical protein
MKNLALHVRPFQDLCHEESKNVIKYGMLCDLPK